MQFTTNAKEMTRAYFDSLMLEERLVGSVQPELSVTIFGHKFDTPITTTALSHLKKFNPGFERPMEAYAGGAAQAGAMHWVGMCESEEFRSIMACGAKTIRFVKPYADREKVFFQLREAEEAGAIAVGMDIDHTFNSRGEPDVVLGEEMGIYAEKDWREFVNAVGLPFVMKGILSVRDAVRCAEMGAAGIVVSHHGGHMVSAVPPLLVLPEIRKALGGDFPIFVDCGVESGLDVYKAMALGATAVGVGGHLIPFTAQGAAAVAGEINNLSAQLCGYMAWTGVKNPASFDPTVIHHRAF